MMRLSEAALAVAGQVVGDDVMFTSVSNDSRIDTPGQLFVAMRGEHVDGHDYAISALENGAAAAMVSRRVEGLRSALLVADTRLALGALAAYWRGRFSIPLAAVTGSNGKTTVKEMLACILRAATTHSADVLATKGNFNNDLGLPLTLLGMRPQHRYAVVEMGMNHFGEIRYLSHIGRPTVALINNACSAHIGELGSVAGIAQAKSEIFEGLAVDGTAVINADDAFADFWRDRAKPHRILTFGIHSAADISASYRLLPAGSELQLNTPQGTAEVQLAVAGLHNVNNALAAAAAAVSMGVGLPAVAAGLVSFTGVAGRLQRKIGMSGARVIDDTYNANPDSVRAAIDVLVAGTGEKLLVLGDMGELGPNAGAMHAEIGRYARQAGVDAVYLLGDLSRETQRAFGTGAQHFATLAALAEALSGHLHQNSTVLVKGSRFMRMERVVELIVSENNQREKI